MPKLFAPWSAANFTWAFSPSRMAVVVTQKKFWSLLPLTE